MTAGLIRFDHGPGGCPAQFTAPQAIISADSAAGVPAALAAMQAATLRGKWLAGYLSYELGYALTPRLAALMPDMRRMPLILMGVFDGPAAADALPAPDGVSVGPLRPDWDPSRHRAAVAAIHDYIAAGDTYQINLTFPLVAEVTGDPLAIYAALSARQPVGEGAFVDLGGPVILSRSPELFFAVDAAGVIRTRPMKGTAARGATPALDRRAAEDLHLSDKNRAENLMIVDLLRNDISRICQPGSVTVPQLFHIEHYATLHQMVSTVQGQLLPGTGLAQIVAALFPCGSITGAPKIRSMQIIAELEGAPREVYCGAIGWVDPSGPARFNVAIRSPWIDAPGRLRLNVGGGIVHDSEAGSEWQEAMCKSEFLAPFPTG